MTSSIDQPWPLVNGAIVSDSRARFMFSLLHAGKLFVFLALGPAVCWPLETGFDDIGESDLGHDLLEFVGLFVRPA